MIEFKIKGRDVNKMICSCGGAFYEADPTEKEEKTYGCGRSGCCVMAIQCDKCKTRVTIDLCAPDWNDDSDY